MQLLIWQIIIYFFIGKDYQKQLALSGKVSTHLSLSYLGGLSYFSSALCHHLVHTDLDHISHNIAWVHCIDDNMMLIGPKEQEVATVLDIVIRLCV